jgi:hypothetical protein
MPIVNLGNQSIGGGATVSDLKFEVVTKQLSTRQEAERVIIGKPLVESGDRGITTNAIFSVRGTQPSHLFGIKQVAVVRGLTAEFSGLKNIDGSITEGTSTLNFTPILDLAVFADVAAGVMSAPQAPFYAERPAFVRPGAQAQLEVKDSPGGSFPFEKRNHVTDRLNFLDSVGQATDFVTFLVVQLPNATHFAIAGFRWTFSASVSVVWTNGRPAASGTARHDFQTSATRADLSPGELGILENPRLGFGDSVVARVNRAKSAADASHVASPIGPSAPAKIDGGGYAIEQFDRFNNAVVNNRKTA